MEKKVDIPPTPFPNVVIFGAGITGLSAAQELAERGFHVHVVDPGGFGDEVEVGGIAKTQWSRIPTNELMSNNSTIPPINLEKITLGTDPDEIQETATIQKIERFTRAARLAHTAQLCEYGERKLRVELKQAYKLIIRKPRLHSKWRFCDQTRRWVLYLKTLGVDSVGIKRSRMPNTYIYCKPLRTHRAFNTNRTYNRGTICRLHKHCNADKKPVWTLEAKPIDLSDKKIPGEHGYRYFPSFYRNIFDTMSRIKLYTGHNCNRQQTRYTIIDNLVAAPDLHIALPDRRPPITLSRRQVRSFEELRRVLSERIGRLNASAADTRHLERKMFRFLTSSTPRREHQYQNQTWWNFLEGYKLQPKLHDLLRHTPQALIAMDADEIDARTHGNILAQLLLDHLRTGEDTDRVLNGPTSTSLFSPWKEHLENIDVCFHKGYLKSLQYCKKSSKIRPNIRLDSREHPEHVQNLENAQYYILAVPYVQALRLTQTLLADQGCGNSPTNNDSKTEANQLERNFRSILEMATSPTAGKDEHKEPQQIRVPRPFEKSRQHIWSFLRLFTGAQFHFDRNVQIGKGHTYYPASPWGLSSISQQHFWKKPDYDKRDKTSRIPPLQGILSVDIGDCSRPVCSIISNETWGIRGSKGDISVTAGGCISCEFQTDDNSNANTPRPARPSDFEISAQKTLPFLLAFELGFNVWQQVGEGLYPGTTDRFGTANWLSVDNYLTDYWHRSYSTCCHHTDIPDKGGLPLSVEDLLDPPGPWYMINTPSLPWERRPGVYIDRPAFMTHDRAIQPLPWSENDQQAWNFDPDRMRVLSYEVSHGQWVLAGAYNKTYTRLETMEAANESARHAVNAILDHYMQSRDKSTPTKLQPMLAEYCKIWDPERNELEDLEVLRRLDELLMRDGLPHFMDLLELDSRLEASAAPSNVTQDRPLDLFLRLLDEATRATPSNESLKDLLTSGKFGGLGKLLSALDRSDSR